MDSVSEQILADYCRSFIHIVKEKVWTRTGFRFVDKNMGNYLLLPRNNSEIRVHRNALEGILKTLFNRGYSVADNTLIVNDRTAVLSDFPTVEHIFISDKKPTEQQKGIIEFALDPNKRSVALEVQTGKGKTFIALYIGYLLKLRMGLFFKGGYTDRWLKDIHELFKLEKHDLFITKGEKNLHRIIEMGISNEIMPKIIIFTHKTLRFLIDDYVSLANEYKIDPYDLLKILGIGYFATDEVHQEFLLNVKRECTTNTYKTLSLSATLCPTDPFVKNMMIFVYPHDIRTTGGEYDKYIAAVCIFYDYKRDVSRTIKYRGGRGTYSHNEYEQWILGHKLVSVQYLRMIKEIIREKYVDVKVDKQKSMVFCASVEMCTRLTEYLAFYFEDLVIKRYCQDDPDSNYEEADITVSTPQSGGTAIDIVDLISVFNTVGIDSQIANEQMKGRLRRLKNYPELTPVIYYLTCTNIDPQMRYYRNKIEYFKNTTISHVKTRYHDILG